MSRPKNTRISWNTSGNSKKKTSASVKRITPKSKLIPKFKKNTNVDMRIFGSNSVDKKFNQAKKLKLFGNAIDGKYQIATAKKEFMLLNTSSSISKTTITSFDVEGKIRTSDLLTTTANYRKFDADSSLLTIKKDSIIFLCESNRVFITDNDRSFFAMIIKNIIINGKHYIISEAYLSKLIENLKLEPH
jgi:hypothetical protein